jgi:predicted methyltransferase
MPHGKANCLLVIRAVAVVTFVGIGWGHAQQRSITAATVQASAPLPPAQIPQPIRYAVNASDRPMADKSLDAGRQPELLLAFWGIRPGMKVADLFAGGGYTTELLARTVGPSGTVYSQNPSFPPEFQQIEQAWTDRLKNPAFRNVTAVHKGFEAEDLLPVPPGSLDAVVMNLNYHDLVLRGIDRNQVNGAVYQALKSGGVYAIVDHSAKDGSATQDIALHRIDEEFVINEVQQSGFRLSARSSALRHPADDRTWTASPRAAGERRGTTDRFVLLFRKP